MPTTYTARIYEGENVTFAEFVMACARAMGPLAALKEEPAGAPVPDEFPPSPHYEQAAGRHRRQLAAIEAWTPEQADADAAAAHAGALREAGLDHADPGPLADGFIALAWSRGWAADSRHDDPAADWRRRIRAGGADRDPGRAGRRARAVRRLADPDSRRRTSRERSVMTRIH